MSAINPIESLDFLKYFPKLETFIFMETNILDGDLTPNLEHPTITYVGMVNKRHYNIKREKLKELLAEKKRGYRMFPNDEDGQVLKMLKKSGVDFSQKHAVDFHVACAGEKSIEATLEILHAQGFQIEGFYDEEQDDWYCTIQVNMLNTSQLWRCRKN